MDIQVITPVLMEGKTPKGYEILHKVWLECNNSPMDDGQLLFHPDDFQKAEMAFAKLGLNVKLPYKL